MCRKKANYKLYNRSGLKQYKCWVVRVGFLSLWQNDIVSWTDTMIQGSRQHAAEEISILIFVDVYIELKFES